MNWLRPLLLGPRGVEVARAIVTAQRDALFVPSMLSDKVRRIDPPNADDEQLFVALEECAFYWSHAYPETENELVEWIQDSCLDEIFKRELDIALPRYYQAAHYRS